jgi:protein-S-isoprenylcysteine O-methyltransferase Ste14
MGLDIRWPIGLMFSLIGALLVICGLVTGSDAEMYKRSLNINVNLYWGLLLLVFGIAMLTLAWRGAQKAKQTADSSPPGKPEELASRQ